MPSEAFSLETVDRCERAAFIRGRIEEAQGQIARMFRIGADMSRRSATLRLSDTVGHGRREMLPAL